MAILTDHALEPGDSYSGWLTTDTDRSWVEGEVVRCTARKTPGGAETSVFEVGLSVQKISGQRPGDGEEPADEDAATAQATPTDEPPTTGIRSSARVEASGMTFRTADLEAEVVNFSSRGLAIKADRPLSEGEAYDGELATEDGRVHLRAIVVWCNETEPEDEEATGYSAGLSLSKVDQRFRPHQETPEPPAELAPLEPGTDLEQGTEEAGGGAGEEAGKDDGAHLAALDSESQPAAGSADAPGPAADLAPWMAALTEDGRDSQRKPLSAQLKALVAILVGLGLIVALWFFLGGSGDEVSGDLRDAATGGSEVTEPATRQPVDEVVATVPVEGDAESSAELDPMETVAWDSATPSETGRPTSETLGEILLRSDVNVRSGPGLDFPIVRRTGDGERWSFIGREGEWLRLQDAEEQWVHQVTVDTFE